MYPKWKLDQNVIVIRTTQNFINSFKHNKTQNETHNTKITQNNRIFLIIKLIASSEMRKTVQLEKFSREIRD